ncbi:MAG: hypothetical protein GXP25_13495 [Planctomycetes bacterium]|nr:hypothetical protein [Planctomycetota bacterium]
MRYVRTQEDHIINGKKQTRRGFLATMGPTGGAAFATAGRLFAVFEEDAHQDQPFPDGNGIPQGAMLREDATA